MHYHNKGKVDNVHTFELGLCCAQTMKTKTYMYLSPIDQLVLM